jgi:LuxR family maltose regulon positive regulatory protein
MPTRPLLAKLTRPRLHGAVPRDRLFDRLDDARGERPALCVVGPPGAGKTTLVASWLDSRRVPGIWYQIDPGDADLPTFFHYLGQACAPFARKGQAPLPALTPEYRDDTAGFSRRFFRELFSRLPAGACVVLDNYHEVPGHEPLHRLIADAVGETPSDMMTIVISRRDPPDTYARLVANENVAMLGWDDLRLSLEEARAIAAPRTAFSDDELTALHRRSDGWAAGLTLMLEGRRRGTSSEAPLPEDREAVFAYFAAQIFDQVSPETQRFLAATAFLPQVPVSIARQLTGEPRAAEILDDLYRRHLFTHRRAGLEPVYWYHALFQDFLATRAESVLGGNRLTPLLVRAAHLLEAAENHDNAFELFRRAEDWLSAARLLERRAASLLSLGRGSALQSWIRSLPPEIVIRRPWLRYWLGIATVPVEPSVARDELEIAWDEFTRLEDHTGRALAAASIIDSYVYEWNDFRPVRPWVDSLASEIPHLHLGDKPEVEQRITCSLLLGMLYAAPDHSELRPCVERVAQILDEGLDAHRRLEAATVLLAYCNLASKPDLGAFVVERGTELATRPEAFPFARMWWQTRLGLFLTLEGRHADACDALDTAESIAADYGFDRTVTAMSLIASYRLIALTAMGDQRRIRECCDAISRPPSIKQPTARYQSIQARLYAAWLTGDLRSAAAIGAESVAIAQATGLIYFEILARANLMIVLACTGDRKALHEALHAQRSRIAGTCFEHYRIEADFVEAWDRLKQGDEEHGLAQLAHAMHLSEDSRRRYLGLFRSSRLIQDLLCRCAESGIAPNHVADFVQRMRVPPPADASVRWPWAVRIRTLGRFEIAIDNTALRFEGKVPRKPLALLKAVIALGGTAVPIARILDALWPDEAGDTAYKSLGVALTRLRKILLVPDIVTVSDEAISINRQLCWIDAFQFLDDTANAVTTDATRHRERAALLYEGAFLPADPEAPWSARMRERLRSRYLATVEALATQAEQDARWDDALEWYRRGTESDELAEALYRGQMRVLRATGRAAEAMSTYRRFRQLLSVVLGIAPSEQTQSLARAIQEETASVGNR